MILANTGIMAAHPDATVSSQRKWLGYIQEEAQRMKELVEDMLFLAKHDGAERPKDSRTVNFSDLVTGCVLRFESVAFERQVELNSHIQPDLSLSGEPDSLERLVMILLDNAVKYAGDRGQVDVALARRQERAVLSVRNTGEPIPPEHLEHLFERFYRVDGSRSRKEGGYGLGLAIAPHHRPVPPGADRGPQQPGGGHRLYRHPPPRPDGGQIPCLLNPLETHRPRPTARLRA